jgi:hypothetical protein
MKPEPVVAALLASGWRKRGPSAATLREAVPARYKNVPDGVLNFLAAVEGAVSTDETAWFLNADDYADKGTMAFRWNEWERISLAAVEGDSQAEARVVSFWDAHFPLLISVRGEYAHFAVAVAGPVVFGREPEFEEVTAICASFADFLELIHQTLQGRALGTNLARVLLVGDGSR